MEEKTKSKGYVLRKLFFACLYLSTFTFGGGYVIVTLLKEKFVDHYHWIEEDEMLDLVAIAQSSPGAIAVNGAIIVGYKLAGIPGMLVSVIGAIIPPMVILSVISVFTMMVCLPIIMRGSRSVRFGVQCSDLWLLLSLFGRYMKGVRMPSGNRFLICSACISRKSRRSYIRRTEIQYPDMTHSEPIPDRRINILHYI